MDKTKLLLAASNYRVQRLIRMGEWLEANKDILVALFDCVDDAHSEAMEVEADDTLILEVLINKQLTALKGLHRVIGPVRNEESWGVVRGEPVTMRHPFAPDELNVQVVLPGVDLEGDQ